MNATRALDEACPDTMLMNVSTTTRTRATRRAAEPGAEAAPGIASLDERGLDALIERVEEAIEHSLALEASDLALLLDALVTLAAVSERLEHNDLTIGKLRKLLGIVRSSEKFSDLAGAFGTGDAEADGREDDEEADDAGKTGPGRRKSPPRKKPKTAPPKPTVVHHPLTELERGQLCPGCAHGKLYKYEPSEFTRIVGHPPYSGERHVSEQLRCNGCGEIHRATLPPEVLADGEAGQTYGYSARTVMAIDKCFDADPFFRQQTVQGLFGRSLSASTIFDQIEHVADALNPVYRALVRAVAASELFHIDDTSHRILDAVPIVKRRGNTTRMRSGVYCSVLSGEVTDVDGEAAVAAAEAAYRVVLYQTNIGNAGEWLEEVLGHRPAGLAAPIVMSDALSSNRVHGVEVRVAGCNAHARRGFVEVIGQYPRAARVALKAFATLWKNEGDIVERGLDPGERLAWHREHSGPAMEGLRAWCETELASGAVEENGTLGQAMGYVLRHYDALTLFLREPGVPLDNNLAERRFARVIDVPCRVGSSGEAASGSALRASHARTRRAVADHNGTERCLRPLPSRCTHAPSPVITSPTLIPTVSDTRAPVLYIRFSISRSRSASQVVPGSASTASICSRERNPSIGRSKRFIGTLSALAALCKHATSRREANCRNERIATRRALRVRTPLPRTVSSSSRNPAIRSGPRSSRSSSVGALPRRRSACASSRVKASR